MRRFLPFAVLLVPLFAAAQSDRAVPLTNARYGPWPYGAVPTVVSNGKDTLLLASNEQGVFAGRLVEGTMKTPHQVFGPGVWNVTAVWRGTHYLVAAQTSWYGVNFYSQMWFREVDVEGRPLREPLSLLPGNAGYARLATNGRTTVVLHGDGWTNSERIRLSRVREGVAPQSTSVLAATSYSHAITSNGDGFAAISSGNGETRAMLFDAEGKHLATTKVGAGTSAHTYDTTIASDGRRYFAVWGGPYGIPLYGCTIEPDGTTGTPLRIATKGRMPTVRWDGSRWEVTYVVEHSYPNPTELLAVTIEGSKVSEPVPIARGAELAAMAHAQGKTVVVWSDEPEQRGALMRAASLEAGRAGATWHPFESAARQTVLKAFDSPAGLTALWNEQAGSNFSLHAGVRARDGSWRETRVADDPSAAAIAYNGINHFIVWQRDGKTYGQWLTPDVQPIFRAAIEIDLDFAVEDMVWNAFGYTLVGRRGAYDTINAARLTSSGATIASVTVQPIVRYGFPGPTAIATDGTQALVVWYHDVGGAFPTIASPEVYAVRYDDSLQPLGPRHLIGTSTWQGSLEARWDGHEYTIAWHGGSDIHRGGLTRDGVVRERVAVTKWDYTVRYADVSILPMPGTAPIVAWQHTRDRSVRFSGFDGLTYIDLDHRLEGRPTLVRLGDSAPAVLASMTAPEEPYYGSARIFFVRLENPDTRTYLDSPLLRAKTDGARTTLTWVVAKKDVITGFRVEKNDDGTWRELDLWVGPEVRSITVDAANRFRIRALADHATGY